MTSIDRPNILFMLADDLGWGDVSYHSSPIRTPNIDRLAREGIELDQHYVCPVCTPTRTSLLTGRYPGRFGRHATVPSNPPVLPDGYQTLASMLRDAGYATGLFGKWHLGSDPIFYPGQYGFDHSYGSLAGGVDPYRHLYKRGPHSRTWHRNGKLIDEIGHVTDLIANEATEWILRQSEPWFCYVPFTAVHTPIRAPEEWIDRYVYGHYDDDPARDRSFKVYAAYASHMDHAVGRLVEILKWLDQTDNTIVVFASDNGASTADPGGDTAKYPGRHEDMPRTGCNAPLRGHKAQLYEGGIRTPAAIAWPGTLAPGRCREPLAIVDWMPTFASLLGCQPQVEPHWDGIDVWPLISTKANNHPHRHLYWNLTHSRFAVREDGWKLILHDREGTPRTELFHIDEDPFEEEDLVQQHPEKVKRLTELIKAEHQMDDTSVRDDIG